MGYAYVVALLLAGALMIPLTRMVRGAWSPATFSQIYAAARNPREAAL